MKSRTNIVTAEDSSQWDLKLNRMIDEYLEKLGIVPCEYIETDHRELAIDLLLRSRCTCVFPVNFIHDSIWKKDIMTFMPGEPMYLHHYVIWKKCSDPSFFGHLMPLFSPQIRLA